MTKQEYDAWIDSEFAKLEEVLFPETKKVTPKK